MDWTQWHERYEDPSSSMSHRLAAVQEAIRAWLDNAPSGPQTVISACAGQGRDLVGALATHPRRDDVAGLLVEYDPAVAERARAAIAGAGLRLDVMTADAGDPSVYRGRPPADLVMFCGVFGNISDEDVRRTIAAFPALCAHGGMVIWTRHRMAPDLTPGIRSWLTDEEFEEVSFSSPGPNRWAVGVHRFAGRTRPLPDATPLFTFLR